ncbi:MAG: hypothetical protein RLZZ293_251 [Pseudomonadota bacterium]|jgi:NAD(P)H-dependent FMN reductase
MQITIISASTRINSQSRKVANYIQNYLANNQLASEIIDLANAEIPQWDESVWKLGKNWSEKWNACANKLNNADAIIMIVPEWHGIVPPALKNLLLLATKQELAHKPTLLVGVSSGTGGNYPLAELRMNSHKNTKVCYIPEQMIIKDVVNLLNSDAELNTSQFAEDTAKRLHYTIDTLLIYAENFIAIRNNALIKQNSYPYGI